MILVYDQRSRLKEGCFSKRNDTKKNELLFINLAAMLSVSIGLWDLYIVCLARLEVRLC